MHAMWKVWVPSLQGHPAPTVLMWGVWPSELHRNCWQLTAVLSGEFPEVYAFLDTRLKLWGREFTIKEKNEWLPCLCLIMELIYINLYIYMCVCVYLCLLTSTSDLTAQLSTFCCWENGMFCFHSFSLFGKCRKLWIFHQAWGGQDFPGLSRYATAPQVWSPGNAAFLFLTWAERKLRQQNHLVFSPSSTSSFCHGPPLQRACLINFDTFLAVWFFGSNLGLL